MSVFFRVFFALISVSSFPVAPARAQDAAELMLRLDRLEGENRRLNGQVEQMTFQVRRLEDQLKKFQNDVDFRFRESGGKPLPTSAPPAQPSQKRSDAFDPSTNPAATGAPRSLGGETVASAPRAPQGAVDGGPVSLDPLATQQRPALNPSPGQTGTARGDFDFAKSFYDRGDYELAEGGFREFLRAHPKDRLAPDAVFYVGETFYRRNRHREAAERYLSVTTDHAKSSRAPEAMLKLGMALRSMGATQEACGTYSEVNRKYPNASASIKQAVDRERKRAQCAA